MRPFLIVLALASVALAQDVRTVKGTVVDDDGNPVEGVPVSLWRRAEGCVSDPRELARIDPIVRSDSQANRLEIAAIVTSGPRGEFVAVVASGVDPWGLTARKGCVCAKEELREESSTILTLDHRVERFSLQVFAGGISVANARAIVRQTGVRNAPPWRASTEWELARDTWVDAVERVDLTCEISCDEKGRADLELVVGAFEALAGFVTVLAPGLAIGIAPLGESATVSLEREAELSGNVRGTDGRAIAAELIAFVDDGDDGVVEVARACADEEGRFAFHGLARRRYYVEVHPAGYVPESILVTPPATHELMLAPGGSLDVGAAIASVAGIGSLVVYDDQGAALGGGERPWDGAMAVTVSVTDSEGAEVAWGAFHLRLDGTERTLPVARFTDLEEGTYRVKLSGGPFSKEESLAVEVLTGKTTRIDLKLAHLRRSVQVHVVDAKRQAVLLTPVRVSFETTSLYTKIDDDGWLRVHGLPHDAVRVTISCMGFKEKVVEIKEGVTEIEVVLDRE